MDISILLSSLLLLTAAASAAAAAAATTCPPAKCSTAPPSPEIHSPFLLSGHHPPQCGLPHFTLFCKQNTTMIHLPNYGDLSLKSISYTQTRLNLVDPKNCVHEVFLNLNLSQTPFTYYYKLQTYNYINCSTRLDHHDSFVRVPCLSDSNHHVYVVRPSFFTPVSCTCVKTVEIPFAYSPYISDSSFGLSLTWSSTRLGEEEAVGILHGLNKYLRVTGIIACAFMVGKLLYATLSNYRQEFNQDKVKKTLGDIEENDELLQEYDDHII